MYQLHHLIQASVKKTKKKERENKATDKTQEKMAGD